MKIDQEFSKNAQSYLEHNSIQNEVVRELVTSVHSKPKRILDLGCGRGGLYGAIDWNIEHFIGIDFAKQMLELHPKAAGVECIYGNFNDPLLYEQLFSYQMEHLFSASALQWADDLDQVFALIKSLRLPISLAIFTSGTFATLNKTASIASLLRSTEAVQALTDKYFDASFEVKHYRLNFENVREMFRYIKKSGVSGSRQILSYKETKALMRDYPVDYLEFEVAFIHSN